MRYTARDQLQRDVTYDFPPKRIVSLCPSVTETLFALGLGEEVVGRTRYCIHPSEQVAGVPDVGGTKDVDLDAVRKLNPGLVIAAREENTSEDVEALSRSMPVFVLNVTSYATAIDALGELGRLVDREETARQVADRIIEAFTRIPALEEVTAAYLLWRDPYMAAGTDSYVDSVLALCGFRNVCTTIPGRYPTVTLDQLRDLGPEHVLLASEPYAFDKEHRKEVAGVLPEARVSLVDGEMFCWYGIRMLPAAAYLRRFLTDVAAHA